MKDTVGVFHTDCSDCSRQHLCSPFFCKLKILILYKHSILSAGADNACKQI
jgi:hypothetical protein